MEDNILFVVHEMDVKGPDHAILGMKPPGPQPDSKLIPKEVRLTWKEALAMGERPWQAWTYAVEAVTTKDEIFVRFAFNPHNEAKGFSGPIGSWVMRASEVAELRASGKSADEIALIVQKRYSLAAAPKFVADVHVPKGTSITIGRVGEQFGGTEGAMQYLLNEYLPKQNFQSNVRTIGEWASGR